MFVLAPTLTPSVAPQGYGNLSTAQLPVRLAHADSRALKPPTRQLPKPAGMLQLALVRSAGANYRQSDSAGCYKAPGRHGAYSPQWVLPAAISGEKKLNCTPLPLRHSAINLILIE